MMSKINNKYTENVYEFRRIDEFHTGTADELMKITSITRPGLQAYVDLIGVRHYKLRAVKHGTKETLYGTLDDLVKLTGYQPQTIRHAITNKGGHARLWSFSFTGQYIVDYIHEEKPGYKQPAKGYQSIKPVYVNKREPMSEYGKYLLAQSFKGWGEAK